VVQLAVTKEGVIGGTVMDQTTGKTFDLAGTVDKQSQRAVWSYKDEAGRDIAMETSIYNLTQPEATAMVHYGPSDMKVVELVRLEAPKTDGAAEPQADGTPGTGVLPAPSVEPLPAPAAAPEATLPVPPEPTNLPVIPVTPVTPELK
jgi:hypothetical protein